MAESGLSLIDWEADWAESSTAMAIGMVVAAVLAVAVVLIMRARSEKSSVEKRCVSMMNVIEIDHLTYSYPGAEQPTLKGITVKIKKGDFLAIVGNNGCGKSTFCKTSTG